MVRKKRQKTGKKAVSRPTFSFFVQRGWHWIGNVMMAGIFFGLFSLGYAGHYTFLSWFELSRLVALCCFAGALIPHRLYRNWLPLTRFDILLFNILGIGPLLFGSVLWVNFLFHGPVEKEVHEIVDRQVERADLLSAGMVMVTLQGEALKEYPEFRKYEVYEGHVEVLKASRVEYKTARGALGWKVLLERNFSGKGEEMQE